MPAIVLVTQEVITHLERENLPLTTVFNLNDIMVNISARDVAESKLAWQYFDLQFDNSLDMSFSALCELSDDDTDVYGTDTRFIERVNQNYESLLLKEQLETNGVKSRCDIYTLYPVNDEQWVIGVQRHICEEHNPSLQTVKKNHALFDALVKQTLHRLPLEEISNTNLFAYYLTSLKYA